MQRCQRVPWHREKWQDSKSLLIEGTPNSTFNTLDSTLNSTLNIILDGRLDDILDSVLNSTLNRALNDRSSKGCAWWRDQSGIHLLWSPLICPPTHVHVFLTAAVTGNNPRHSSLHMTHSMTASSQVDKDIIATASLTCRQRNWELSERGTGWQSLTVAAG